MTVKVTGPRDGHNVDVFEALILTAGLATSTITFIGPLPAGQARAEQYWINFFTDRVDGWFWPYREAPRDHIPRAVFNWAQGITGWFVWLFVR